MKSVLNDKIPNPKGGMEVGMLSVAVLVVLIFFYLWISPNEQGIEFEFGWSKLHETDDPEARETEFISIYGNETAEFQNQEYSLVEFFNYIRESRLDREKVYLIRTTRDTEIGYIIQVKDQLILKGVPRSRIYLGGSFDYSPDG